MSALLPLLGAVLLVAAVSAGGAALLVWWAVRVQNAEALPDES